MRVRPRSDEGFSLIELMVAIVVFMVASSATISVIILATRTIRDNSDRVYAADLARTEIDRMRELGPDNITLGLISRSSTSTQGTFTVNTTSNWVGLNQTTNACTAGTPGKAYMRVHVEVTGGSLKAPQRMDTVVAPADDSPLNNVGSLSIQVSDESDKPVSGVSVTGRDLAGSATFPSYVTGPDGCIFVPDLTPSASWQITIARTGFVPSPTSNTVLTRQVTVGQNTRVTFQYAEAARLLVGSPDPKFVIPATMPVSYGPAPTSISSVAIASFPGAIGSLWPATGGYQAWLGNCLDADPTYATSPRTNGTPRTWYVTKPGQTTDTRLPGVAVTVRGLPANRAVSLKHLAEASGSCTSAKTFALGSTDATGRLFAFLPYGKWTFSTTGTPDITTVLEPTKATETVAFPLANLDIPCPSPTATPTSTPTATPTATPSPTCLVVP